MIVDLGLDGEDVEERIGFCVAGGERGELDNGELAVLLLVGGGGGEGDGEGGFEPGVKEVRSVGLVSGMRGLRFVVSI